MTSPEERAVTPEAPRPEAQGERSFGPAAEPTPEAEPRTEQLPPVQQHPPREQPAAAAAPPAASYGGVPPRPNPLPPPRPVAAGAPAATSVLPPRGGPRTSAAASAPRPVAARGRRARLTLRRIDPWSVFLYSVVASIFLGLALLVCVAVLYAVLSQLGVLDSVNTLIGDVTSDPGEAAEPASFLSGGRVLGVTAVLAALDVVLLTALSTLGAFLYNLCAALTGGIEVTLGDRE